VASTGFRINRIEEPQPSDQACEARSRWRDLAAFMLLVMAERPK
jgi:hypothetical protein